MKRFLSVILATILIVSALPMTASAYDGTFNVSTAQELYAAQSEINGATDDGSTYLISLQDDIALTNGGVTFDNAKTTTTIIGNGYEIAIANAIDSTIAVWNGATLNLGDENNAANTLTITGGQYGENPGAMTAVLGSIINMYDGVTIKDNETSNYFGGGATIEGGSTFHMYGGTITNCGVNDGSVCYGGGVSALNGSTFIMDGGTISGCYATSNYIDDGDPNRSFTAMGGGVYVSNGSFFQMNDGTISNCSATNFGGGVALDQSYGEQQTFGMGNPQSRVEINGGTIDSNSAVAGAGVFASGYFYTFADVINHWDYDHTIDGLVAGFVINGGTISNNETTGDSGGGVYVAMLRSSKKAEIHNATITGNSAYDGGGIENFGYWTQMLIDGCTITGNESETNGGGVMASTNSSGGFTTIKDCTITGNTSGAQGAGVYYDNNSALRITGANTIQNNEWNGTLNNLNVLSTSKPVTVIGALTGSQIGITDPTLRDDGKTDEDSTAASSNALTSGYKTYNSANPKTLFTSDHKTWIPAFNGDNQSGNEVRLIKKTDPENSVYLTTKDSVDINFVIDADYYTDDPDAYFRLNYNHNPKTYETDFKDIDVPVKNVEKTADGRYKFTIVSAPAQLTESIKITLYDSNDTKLYDADYSMWQYCQDIMAQYISIEQHTSTDMYDEAQEEQWRKASELCKSLVDYATAAQVYFSYNTADMASKKVTDEETYYHDDITNENYYHNVAGVSKNDVKTTGNAVASISGSFPVSDTSLMSLSNTEARFYYEEELDPSDYELSVSVSNWYGNSRPTAKFETARSGKFISVGGIESVNIDNPFTLTIRQKSTGDVTTIRYNATAYCFTVLRDTESSTDQKETELRTLVKAVYLYNRYAQDYFEPQG